MKHLLGLAAVAAFSSATMLAQNNSIQLRNGANTALIAAPSSGGALTFTLPSAGGTLLTNSASGSTTLGNLTTAGSLVIHDGNGQIGTLETADLTADRTYTFPDATGTVALTPSGAAGLVTYGPSTPQNTLTTGSVYLFDLAYSGSPGTTVGAQIVSAASGTDQSATALTLTATPTGTGTGIALDVTGGGIRTAATSIPDASDMVNRELTVYNTSTNFLERVTVDEALGGTPVLYGTVAPQSNEGTGGEYLFNVQYSATPTGSTLAGARVGSVGTGTDQSSTALTLLSTSTGVGDAQGIVLTSNGGDFNTGIEVNVATPTMLGTTRGIVVGATGAGAGTATGISVSATGANTNNAIDVTAGNVVLATGSNLTVGGRTTIDGATVTAPPATIGATLTGAGNFNLAAPLNASFIVVNATSTDAGAKTITFPDGANATNGQRLLVKINVDINLGNGPIELVNVGFDPADQFELTDGYDGSTFFLDLLFDATLDGGTGQWVLVHPATNY
jgi:hypothetical protein